MEEWRLLDNSVPYGADMNLAIEEAVFIEKMLGKVPPTIRFWRNNRVVVVGYSQSVKAEVNLKVCNKEGIEVVRRFSGGGTVYQDHGNLNYSIIIELYNPLVKGLDIPQSLRTLCSGVISALKTFGTNSIFKSPSNILINSKKVSGNAQARKKEAILHHGTLLINVDLNLLADVLNAPNCIGTIKGVASKRSPVTNLSDELGWQVSMEKIKESLQQGFEHTFSIHLLKGSLTQTEKELAEKLYAKKYSKKEWNYWR